MEGNKSILSGCFTKMPLFMNCQILYCLLVWTINTHDVTRPILVKQDFKRNDK